MTDNTMWDSLIKLFIFLPFIIFLIYLMGKIGGNKLKTYNNGRIIKIIERVAVSKDNSLLVASIGEKYYVISSSNGKIEILLEIDEEYIIKAKENNEMMNFVNIHEFYKNRKNKKED